MGITKAALIVAVSLVLMAIGAVVFIASGIYNIGADDHHTRIVLAVITQLRERSIDARASRITVPDLKDGSRVAGGAGYYAALCVGCHLAPGVTKSDLRPGLYPHPPNLAQQDVLDARKAFWIIKHGIKMSGMSAWGKTHSDDEIWNMVAFLQKLPKLTPGEYKMLVGIAVGHHDHNDHMNMNH
jgi:mono/diheme cytochrome c family protein